MLTVSKGHVMITLFMKIFMHSEEHGRKKPFNIGSWLSFTGMCPVNITLQALLNISK